MGSAASRIGVMASGSGTILRAILDADLPVVVLVVDRPCGATAIADDRGVPVELVERTSFGPSFDRDAFTQLVADALKRHEVDLVAMAGYGTVLPALPSIWGPRILNTHPALLPAFKGWHAVDDALAAGVKVTGWTMHVVTEEVDAGPIIAQEAVPVLDGDTKETLHERIKEVERRMYPQTIRRIVDGEIEL